MNKELSAILASLVIGMILLVGTSLDSPSVRSDSNVTVFLNVTNTEPTVFEVVVDDATNSPVDEIDLTASSTREVVCNASISDYNGFSDIAGGMATARFYSTVSSSFDDAPDNNNHYRNTSCNEFHPIAGAPNNASGICRFNVEYYANNETWECVYNFTDSGGTALQDDEINLSSNNSDTTVILGLLAMQVNATSVDYGNLTVTETSEEKEINITNGGNIQTNTSVRGFGGLNETLGNGFAMVCQQNNISIGLHRYSNTSGVAFDDMLNLTNESYVFPGLQLLQRTNDAEPQQGEDLNSTYWRIQVPLGVGGICNGTIAFQATNEAWGTDLVP